MSIGLVTLKDRQPLLRGGRVAHALYAPKASDRVESPKVHGGGSLNVAKVGSVNADAAQELRERVDVDTVSVGSVGACIDGVELTFGTAEGVAAKDGRVDHVALQVTDK